MLFPDLFLVLFFWLHHAACRILVPHPGIKPKPSVVKLWSPNHQTSRKFPGSISCDWFYFLSCFLPFLIFYCKLNIMGPSVFRFLLSFWVRPIFEVFKTDFFFFFGLCSALHEILVSDQGWNWGPRQWKRSVLTTDRQGFPWGFFGWAGWRSLVAAL